jgi:hypothetical protein
MSRTLCTVTNARGLDMVKMRAIAMQSALNVDRRATTNYIVKLPYIAQTVQALMQLSQKIAQHGQDNERSHS